MSEDLWILGIHMTKFGKYPDRDTVDLATEATLAALADAGATMKDMGVIAAGNLINVEPSPEHVSLGMKVRLATYSLGTDDTGTEAIGFGFEPA